MLVFDRITIVGLGLIGGSLGMALRRKRLAREVVGVSRRAVTARRAKTRGAVDLGMMDSKRAVREADLVILATPVEAIVPTALRLAKTMRPGSILTDVGSSKGAIVRALERRLPHHVAFVGGHPLAGSEQQGIEAADASLFDGSVCILTKTARTDPRALARVRQLWAPLVERVVLMSPARHDRLLAQMSHLPHVIAFCLASAVEREGLAVAPRSFLDMTRIAKSSPQLWDDIFLSNRDGVLASMARFEHRWRALRKLITQGRGSSLRRALARAGAVRHALGDP